MNSILPINKVPSLLLMASLSASPALFGSFVTAEDFESLSLGAQSANGAGSFTIIDGSSIFGTGNAAQITSASMTHRFDWSGDAQPVITVAFDFYNGSGITEAQPLRFAFNQNGNSLMSGGNNVVRLAMKQDGTFDFEATPAAAEVYTNASYPLDTAMTLYLVFNSTAAAVTYMDGITTIDANTIELWTEIGGVLSHVGYSPFDPTKVDSPLHSMGFATNSTFGTDGDFIVDNLRWADGVTVIPEPSTYSVLAGLFVLGLVIARRRSALLEK